MPVDTQRKRASTICHGGRFWKGKAVVPDGSLDSGDRAHTATVYSGIFAPIVGGAGVRRIRNMHLGDVTAGEQFLTFMFTTADADGVPTPLVGGALSVYSEISIAQSTSGVTLTVNFDGVTGLNHVRINTSLLPTFWKSVV